MLLFNEDFLTSCSVGLGLFLSRSLLELHLSEMEDGAGRLVEAHLLLIGESEHTETFLQTQTYTSLR